MIPPSDLQPREERGEASKKEARGMSQPSAFFGRDKHIVPPQRAWCNRVRGVRLPFQLWFTPFSSLPGAERSSTSPTREMT